MYNNKFLYKIHSSPLLIISNLQLIILIKDKAEKQYLNRRRMIIPYHFPQHFLYFLPLPQEQGSFLPIFFST